LPRDVTTPAFRQQAPHLPSEDHLQAQANDLATARKHNDRIWPTAEVFYTEPWVDMHNRMKEALVLLGRLPRAVARSPLMKLSAAEIERIRQALVAAGLLADNAVAKKKRPWSSPHSPGGIPTASHRRIGTWNGYRPSADTQSPRWPRRIGSGTALLPTLHGHDGTWRSAEQCAVAA